MNNVIRWFDTLGIADLALVGGKNASLGEMTRALGALGVQVPDGFAITTDAYAALVDHPRIRAALPALLAGVNPDDPDDLARRGQAARSLIREAGLPQEVREQILAAYKRLSERTGSLEPDVAVRSSATAEDLPDASFAGQQQTFLHIRGDGPVLDACLDCFASLFTDRAIAYRVHKKIDQLSVRLSVGIQTMVRSDLGAAGVVFTLDTESGFRDAILVSSAYGLGENVVAGRVDPDEFVVFKPALREGYRAIIRRRIGQKQLRRIYRGHGTHATDDVTVAPEDRERQSISDDDVLKLARWALLIEEHYSRQNGRPTPMDIEWASDGTEGGLFIVQARPETVEARRDPLVRETYTLQGTGVKLLRGRSIGERVGAGPVRVMKSTHELGEFQDGDVLVADMTDPDWEPIMKRASAIVTNRGGRTCHAAIVSRELGVPCVVGTGRGTDLLKNGRQVTVSCAQGEEGIVFDGKIPFQVTSLRLDELPKTRTHILLNIANPDEAFSLSSLPVQGVGLAREEFIIAHEVKVHPLALTRFDEIKDEAVKAAISRLTRGYVRREDYFVERLAEGIGMIAAAFHPREVIVRLSDFKTNEYANLLGGAQFEPREENPMIGFRGACRYTDPRYKDGFALECQALLMVRQQMGLKNVKIMVPFCRTPAEGERVVAEMAKNGLRRGEQGLEIYVMCELPSNVILADRFAEVFDGFSIGSNDLTQLTLGLDRDSEIVAPLFDERDEAVLRSITEAIRAAHAAGRKIGICGQAPSDYPEFARFLVSRGIDSISLSADSVLKTIGIVAEAEMAHAHEAGNRPPEFAARVPLKDMDPSC